MRTKNKGTVGGIVMDTFFGCRRLSFGVFSETLVTMELKIVIRRHTRYRGCEKRAQRETPSETPCPALAVRNSICLETCGKTKSGFSCRRGATFLNLVGRAIKRKYKKCRRKIRGLSEALYGTLFLPSATLFWCVFEDFGDYVIEKSGL